LSVAAAWTAIFLSGIEGKFSPLCAISQDSVADQTYDSGLSLRNSIAEAAAI
jgi:hypothetical protein